MIQDLTTYLLTGLIITILIPWACLETASFFSSLKTRPSYSRHSHWLWAVLIVGSLTLSSCAGGSKENAGDIVSPKEGGGAGVTRTESGESVLPEGLGTGGTAATAGTSDTGGTTASGGSGGSSGGSGGSVLSVPPLEPGTSPALIMQVVNTILN